MIYRLLTRMPVSVREVYLYCLLMDLAQQGILKLTAAREDQRTAHFREPNGNLFVAPKSQITDEQIDEVIAVPHGDV
jgi:hypothetical protein